MAVRRIALEMGMGTSLRKASYTSAAVRALENAVWRNSISFAEAFGFDKSAMLIDVEIGVQHPDKVDLDAVRAVLPYGQIRVKVDVGGLDIPRPDGKGVTILANAAVIVAFDMEKSENTREPGNDSGSGDNDTFGAVS
ncbi:Lin0512 family protein [Alphaproteobacteria bacterium]|jgi:uncharacterized protein (TIGR02058 family)|nr:Lin0512 family protein [Alphaproteobacteria bacterium]